jgi:signal transduction histidine kinase
VGSAAFALLVALADVVVLFTLGRPHVAQAAAVAVVAVLAVRWPRLAFPLAVAVSLPGGAHALLLWTAFHLGRRVPPRWGAAIVAASVAGAQAVLWPEPVWAVYLVFAGLAWLTGLHLAQRRSLRTHRRLLADHGILHERLRIARDMHDSLGHRLSLISVQAAALEVADLPPQERETVRRLAASSRQALDDLHDLVGTLRTEGDRRTLGDLDALVAEFRAEGSPVVVHRAGRVPDAPPDVEQAAYRVVQEGLANAARHAPGAEVAVSLRREDDTLLVTVTNAAPGLAAVPGTAANAAAITFVNPTTDLDAAPARDVGNAATPAARTGSTGGYGLAGLDERVRLAGGAFQVSRTGAEFRITAMLPLADEPVRERLWPIALALGGLALAVLGGWG